MSLVSTTRGHTTTCSPQCKARKYKQLETDVHGITIMFLSFSRPAIPCVVIGPATVEFAILLLRS